MIASRRISRVISAIALVSLGAFGFAPPVQADLLSGDAAPPAGPDDDLGTLPSTAAPPSNTEDDLGTLPSTKRPDPGPSIVITGYAPHVEGLLGGLQGRGSVTVDPDPVREGFVIATLRGDLRLALRWNDPRLEYIRLQLDTGSVPGLAELRAGPRSTGVFAFSADTRMNLPVRRLSERQGLVFDFLPVTGGAHQVGFNVHGSHLVLSLDS